MKKTAILSEDRKYRYILQRTWDASKPAVMFIGLNPSTADETEDDPTIRRCVNFSKNWGYGTMYMVNLFAFRSTKPQKLYNVADPIGKANDSYIEEYSKKVEKIIACWGSHGSYMNRSKVIRELIPSLECFKINKNGEPRHPLYLSRNQKTKPYI